MTILELILLALLFCITSVVGVVTGSNSLVTVPVMFQFGIDEKTAIATNMFGLTFMAIGGTIPFARQGAIEFSKLSPLIIVTIIGSAIGAVMVGMISNNAIRLIVSIAMIVIVLFTVMRPARQKSSDSRSTDGPASPTIGVAALLVTFVLAIYGGLYSGGYVTVLTAGLVAFSGLTFGQSIAATKFINVFSSGIATLVFMWQGLVDYKLGIILAIAMFVGAYVGAHYATKLNEDWLKRIFLTTVLLLAIKTIYDFF